MIVTFISQCEKKAIPRTRRVLDAFADRIGNNTWQTVITEDGLLAVIVKLLYYSYKIRKKLEITHRLSRSTILYAYV
ncbi:hypothetical protein MSG83_18040 [Acinetobacter baumannii]|nr:hypothetical protein [Acinetobacter baumannii]MDV4251401.1 hypothetical protein [Acinetobacter baumannii]MDV4290541.1 hypothetical protein [Acinetobacter baumannii]